MFTEHPLLLKGCVGSQGAGDQQAKAKEQEDTSRSPGEIFHTSLEHVADTMMGFGPELPAIA